MNKLTSYNTFIPCCFTLIVFTIFDTIATLVILKNGGHELNPIVNILIQRYGFISLIILKEVIIISILAFLMINKIGSVIANNKIIMTILNCVTMAYVIVVFYEFALLLFGG